MEPFLSKQIISYSNNNPSALASVSTVCTSWRDVVETSPEMYFDPTCFKQHRTAQTSAISRNRSAAIDLAVLLAPAAADLQQVLQKTVLLQQHSCSLFGKVC